MFGEIVATNGPVKYEVFERGNLKMAGHKVPLSIKEAEFEFIKNLVIDNNLQRGFEVATGFGISGLAAAVGFKQTGGKLVTMDAYIEEKHNDAGTYETLEQATYEDMDGYKSVNFLREHFELEEHFIPTVGWSPDDVGPVITAVFGEAALLDYVFIDGGHFTEQIRKDFWGIQPFFDRRCFIVFHDVYDDFFTPELKQEMEECCQSKLEIVIPYIHGGENLGLLIRNQ